MENRWCEHVINYWFDESVTADPGPITINNVYYHLWYSSLTNPNANPWVGLQRTQKQFDNTAEVLSGALIPTTRYSNFYWKMPPTTGDQTSPIYGLTTGLQTVNATARNTFSSNSIYEMYLTMPAGLGSFPAVVSSRRTPSFVLFNVPPDIATRHSDTDGLTDAVELNDSHTSPFLADTDNDGISDSVEWNNGVGGTNPNDPCNLHVISPNGGEIWTIGGVRTISFTPVPANCIEARLFLQRGTGQPWQLITSTPLAGLSQYAWTVTGAAANQCKVKVAFDAADPGDPSDAPFQIKVGGGCPFLYARQEGEWTELNSILTEVTPELGGSSEADVVDRFVLRSPPSIEDGAYRFELREFEEERSWIDAVQLEIVDHPIGTELGVSSTGDVFLFGEGVAPDKAVDGQGSDRLADVVAADQRLFNGRAGDVLFLEYAVPADGRGHRIQLVTANKPPLDGPGQSVPGPGSGIRVSIERPGEETPAVEMQVTPRENLAPRWIDLPVGVNGDTHPTNRVVVRLEWGSDHPLDFAGLVSPSEVQPELRTVTLMEALNPAGNPVMGALDPASAGDGGAVLNPGDKISLAFQADGSEPAGRRDFLFTVRGHYIHLGAKDRSDPGSPAGLDLTVSPRTTESAEVDIAFSIDRADDVRVDIYSVTGRLVRTLSEGHVEPGRHQLIWDARDSDHQKVGAGVYFCRIRASHQSDSERILIHR